MNDTLEYQKFMTQEHRFELNGCNLKYNDKPFELGMSMQQFKEIFGNETSSYQSEFQDENTIKYFWKDLGLKITVFNSHITHIYIYIQNTYLEYPNVHMMGNRTIVFNDILLNQTDKMHEYIKRADTTFDEIGIKSSGYTFRYPCNKELIYFLDSPVSYYRKGGGHLYISGDWKLEETNEVKSIHIYYDEKI
ncbi:DUF7738 domain-containing protein [Tenacibaculum caenipelagi]|nr:hypothetical protein [Tenacibaculum caenipelagi]